MSNSQKLEELGVGHITPKSRGKDLADILVGWVRFC